MTRFAVIIVLSAIGLPPASAATIVEGPNGLSIDRDDVRLYPNGTIETSKEATLVYPDKRGCFEEASFGPKTVSSSGLDLGEGFNASCGKK